MFLTLLCKKKLLLSSNKTVEKGRNNPNCGQIEVRCCLLSVQVTQLRGLAGCAL